MDLWRSVLGVQELDSDVHRCMSSLALKSVFGRLSVPLGESFLMVCRARVSVYVMMQVLISLLLLLFFCDRKWFSRFPSLPLFCVVIQGYKWADPTAGDA